MNQIFFIIIDLYFYFMLYSKYVAYFGDFMRYLGNKARMINNIESFIDELGITGKVFCDLFTGSASVADFFKDRYKINLVKSTELF